MIVLLLLLFLLPLWGLNRQTGDCLSKIRHLPLMDSLWRRYSCVMPTSLCFVRWDMNSLEEAMQGFYGCLKGLSQVA